MNWVWCSSVEQSNRCTVSCRGYGLVHAVSTEARTDNGELVPGTHTGYFGNLSAPDLLRLRMRRGRESVTEVSAIPFDLLRPCDVLELVSVADSEGLVWHVAPYLTDADGMGTSLRVYDRDTGERLVDMVWREGELTGDGRDRMTTPYARHVLETATEGRRDTA